MLTKIFKLSPFVENQFQQLPELQTLLTTDFDLNKDWQEYKNTHSELDIFSLLRVYRQSRLALIAAKDCQLNNLEAHINTLKLTSHLARLMIQHAQATAQNEFQAKYGCVINANNQVQDFIIFALGKLGGDELNYSSDVDLIFCYTGEGESDGHIRLDAQDYFNKLGRRIIHLLESFTSHGIVYRVDMRLRPFGTAAPLVYRCGNLLDYLQTEGRDWERYAWLRASFVAGNEAVANQTLAQIQAFIYRKYLDYAIFASLRQIKAQIARKQQHDMDNIKLGSGGIREIEFIVQTLQLTFAGRNKQLRGNDLWQQMHNLQAHKHLSVKELQQLSSAWLFLRKLENLCQIIDDSDQHHLPQNLLPLAQCMNFNCEQDLLDQLNQHRNNVHTIFAQLFISNQTDNNQSLTHPVVQKLKDEISQKNYPKSSRHKMYAALDALLPCLNTHSLNTHNNDVLIYRYWQVIHAVSKRPNYLSMLIESPIILQKLIQQLTYSDYFSHTIAKTPSLLEILFEDLDENDFLIDTQWQHFAKKFNLDDQESYLETLCQFKQRIQFKVVMAYVDGIHNAQQTCQILSQLAQYILALVVHLAWHHSQKKSPCAITPEQLIVIAYGSLAMQSMHLNSDFDLVFIFDQDITDENYTFVLRWIKRIIHLLSIQTYYGHLYQLDTQLRPNGNSGAVVVSQSNFENYHHHQAWLWEHAALIKSRAVYATVQQVEWFKQFRKSIICQKRTPASVDAALSDMANKLQQMGKKNHHQEFDNLGIILKQAHTTPAIIDSIFVQQSNCKTKLDQSILAC